MSSSDSSDEQLDRATAELRETHADGPPPELRARTLATLRREARRATLSRSLKVAAAVAALASGIAAYVAYTSDRPPVVVNPVVPPPAPTPKPAPAVPSPTSAPLKHPQAPPATVPATAPAERERRLVQAPPPPAPPPAVAAGPSSITGTVRFEGEAPEPTQIDMSAVKECAAQHPDGAFDEGLVVADGKLANVVVYVRFPGDPPAAAPPPSEPAVLDQRGCQYHPHVLAMRVGQTLAITNNDNFLHNIHALAIDNPPFNFGQPTKDPLGRKVGAMKVAEVFKVKCDVHPWMGAYVHVFEHPYFAVTKEDGSFAIPPGLADGHYTLVAWQEKLGERQVEVDVKGGKAAGADFVFRAQ